MFSVVIPLYNKELSIQNTIKSVLQQSFQEFEIVVVNDGSTDASVIRVEEIDDSRIRVVHQKNQGVSAARNKGVAEAKFSWIAFLDGDDLWEPNHLEEITKMMNMYPEEKVFATSFNYSTNVSVFRHKRNETVSKIKNYFVEARREMLMWTSVVVINKKCLSSVGDFNIKLSYGEDLDLWARLMQQFALIKSQVVTATYRLDAENRSNASFFPEKSRVFNLKVSDAKSQDEKQYYQLEIARALRRYIRSRRFKLFFKLYRNNCNYKYISILIIFGLSAK